MKTKILNLYSGIGGNTKNWDRNKYDVTSIEYHNGIGSAYNHFFPEDKILIEDAHEYLLKNYKEYDFIWSSPPCQTHSDIRRMGAVAGMYDAKFPDMNLWQEIVFLKHFFKGGWVVENVKPYYEPFVKPDKIIGRHYMWSNIKIPDLLIDERLNIRKKSMTGYGFDLTNIKTGHRKDQIIRNLVNPVIGEHILKAWEEKRKEKEIEAPTLFNELN